jgi:anti-sigma factor RsiW
VSRDARCADIVELMTAYIENALPPGERTSFETHLVCCPGCVGYLSQFRATVEELQRLAAPRLDATDRESMIAEFRRATVGRSP